MISLLIGLGLPNNQLSKDISKKISNEDKFTASHYCANTVHSRRAECTYNGLQALYEDKGWEKGKVWTFRINQQPSTALWGLSVLLHRAPP